MATWDSDRRLSPPVVMGAAGNGGGGERGRGGGQDTELAAALARDEGGRYGW